jgi:hypothetical protein
MDTGANALVVCSMRWEGIFSSTAIAAKHALEAEL